MDFSAVVDSVCSDLKVLPLSEQVLLFVLLE